MSYNPNTPDSWIDYQVNDITGQWHQDSMHLDVLTRKPFPYNGFQRITRIQTGNLNARVYGPGGVVCTKPRPGYALFEATTADGEGEMVSNLSMSQVPPILLLQAVLSPGRKINGTSTVVAPTPDDGYESFDFPWRNGTIHVKQPWGSWPDTCRTALWENPADPNGAVYNYVWAWNIGLVHFWRDTLGPVNAGSEYYATGWGGV